MQGQYRDIHSKFYSAQANLSVAKKFETGFGTHDLKLGLYGSFYGEDSRTLYQNYLIEVAGKPRTLTATVKSSSTLESKLEMTWPRWFREMFERQPNPST